MLITADASNVCIRNKQYYRIVIIIYEYWPVKSHQRMNISSNLIDGEDGPSSFPWQSVHHRTVSMVHVCVELQEEETYT